MADHSRGIHPRLVPPPPEPRPSLALLSGLSDAGEDFAWALWYAVWRVHGGAEPAGGAGEMRPDRFQAAFGSVPELDGALQALLEFLNGLGTPNGAADALLRISEWALEHGHAEAAIQCAEAAAHLLPESPRRSLAAGRANRIFSEPARAAIYYERAMTLARPRRKWRTYVRAHLGLGQVKKTLGDTAGARAHYFTAARAARNLSGEKWLAAQTQHDLMALCAEDGEFENALYHAQLALEWYPRHHSRLPALAHDIAFLLVRLNLYRPAVPLLQAVMAAEIPSADQVIGWSTLARAEAGIGNVAGYEHASDAVLRLVGLFDLHAAAAFDNLAQGACLLALWSQAEQYAIRSAEIASRTGQHATNQNALRALGYARTQRVPASPQVLLESSTTSVNTLAADAAGALAIWRGVTWKRKRQSGPERLGRV